MKSIVLKDYGGLQKSLDRSETFINSKYPNYIRRNFTFTKQIEISRLCGENHKENKICLTIPLAGQLLRIPDDYIDIDANQLWENQLATLELDNDDKINKNEGYFIRMIVEKFNCSSTK